VLKIGVDRIMRSGQLVALLAVLIEAWIMLDYSWGRFGNLPGDSDALSVVAVVAVLLIFSELVRVGRSTSIRWLMWLGFIARFAALGWAGTGLLALLALWAVSDSVGEPLAGSFFWAAGGLALMTSAYAFTIGRNRIVVRKFRIARSHPAGDAGRQYEFRITVLSDLHLGEFVTAEHIRRAVEISNSESPDIVLLLGDYVDSDGSLADRLVAELTLLEAKLGVFAVLGNHDIRSAGSQMIIDALERDPNLALLRDASAFVEVGAGDESKTVQIIGIESPSDWRSSKLIIFGGEVLDAELPGSRADFRIVASHHPEVIFPAAKTSVDLIVAGHTHGGQLAVPFTGRFLNVGRLVAKYFLGLYELGTTTLVVSAGIGVGVIPARIGVPPEVTLIEISLD